MKELYTTLLFSARIIESIFKKLKFWGGFYKHFQKLCRFSSRFADELR
jgi:hypothetical protein